MKKFVLLIALCIVASLCLSYAWADDNGTIHYCSVPDEIKGLGYNSAIELSSGDNDYFDYAVPEDGVTLLLFYSNSCGNSRRVFSELAQSQWINDERIGFVAIESTGDSGENTRAFMQETTGDQMSRFTVLYNCGSLPFDYASLVGDYDYLTFPLVIIAKNGSDGVRLCCTSTGYQSPQAYSDAITAVLNAGQTSVELSYYIDGQEITITGCSTYPEHLVIPAFIDGLPVTKIGSSAFWQTQIKSVSLPDTITHLEYWAFADCNKLTEIRLPYSLEHLGDQVFYECDQLSDIQVDARNKHFKVIDQILYTADGKELVFYPQTKKNISFAIPEGVTKLWPYAMSFSAFEELVLPDSLTEFTRKSVYACQNLVRYCVSDTHPTIAERDGFLYNKDYTVLLACPDTVSGSYSIPEGVTRIEEMAFSNCWTLYTITTPSSLREIGYRAFGECLNLVTLNLSEGLRIIGTEALYCCISLREIVFPKSLEEIGYTCFLHSALSELYFLGDAPIAGQLLDINNPSYRIYCMENSTGWDNAPWSTHERSFWDGKTLALLSGNGYDYYGASYSWEYDRNSCTLKLSGPTLRVPHNYHSSGWTQYALQTRHIVLENTLSFEANVCAMYPSLESISLPASLENIPDTAFNSAARAIHIILEPGSEHFHVQDGILYSADMSRLLYAGGLEGQKEYTVPDIVTTIDYYAFLNTRITELVLPPNLESGFIGLRLSTLQRVSISGSSTFEAVDGILYSADMPWVIFCPNGRTGSYTLREGTTLVERYAFAYSSLSAIELGDSLYTIMPNAFYGSALKKVCLPPSVSGVSESAFAASALEEFETARTEDYLFIADSAFKDCAKLRRADISGASNLGYSLFYGCTSLTEVHLPDRITQINNYTFRNCSSLTSIVLPKSLIAIGYKAFEGCTSLQRIYAPGVPPSFRTDDFKDNRIKPEMIVDKDSENWQLITDEWGGCRVVDWVKPETATAKWSGDELHITLRGVCRADPLWVVFYSSNGRMLNCLTVPMEEGHMDSLPVPENAYSIRIFFMGKNFAPTRSVLLPV